MNPIITSLIDTDFYKFTMGQFIYDYYPKVKATFELINRNPHDKIWKGIDLTELREQFEHTKKLCLTQADGRALLAVAPGIFSDDYIGQLLSGPLSDYQVKSLDDGVHICFEGLWWQASLWETFAMNIVNTMYYKNVNRHSEAVAGREKDKFHLIEEFGRVNKRSILWPEKRLNVVDFGTRRRFNRDWHEHILTNHAAFLSGTSNVQFADRFKLPVVGTMAHEIFMGVAALHDHSDSSLLGSQQVVLGQWWKRFGKTLSIALSDTWGAQFFLEDFTQEQYRTWNGVRQDSGDPFDFGRRLFSKYVVEIGRPKDKTIVFSDGLDVLKIIKLELEFGKLINCVYGWGTDLTNDVGLPVPKIVVKMTSIDGKPTVKLSDSPEKELGPMNLRGKYWRVFRGTNTKVMGRTPSY